MSRKGKNSLRVWLPAIRAGSGADIFTTRLAEALRHAGHEASITWFPHRTEFFPWVLRAARIPKDIDVVHTGLALGQAFSGRGYPVVVTAHQYIRDPVFLKQRSMAQAFYHRVALLPPLRASLRLADIVTAVSAYTADAMAVDMSARPEVVHNWVDTSAFFPADYSARKDNTRLRLLFVGNPSRWKGVDVIPALARRIEDVADIHCLGGLRRGFSAEFASLKNIRVLDRVDPFRMPELYRTVDAVLVPTRYEAFGYVALEAMASGLPVVGFASTGTSEVCIDGATALLGPVDDIDRLEAHVRSLLDPSLRHDLGQAGYERARTVFSENAAVDAYVAIYRALL